MDKNLVEIGNKRKYEYRSRKCSASSKWYTANADQNPRVEMYMNMSGNP